MQSAILRPFASLFCALGLACLTPVTAVADIPFITGITTFSTPQHFQSRAQGMVLYNTSGTSITITKLGRWVIAGNNQVHTLSIYDNNTAAPSVLASVTVDCNGATPGQFIYATLPTPFVLAPDDVCNIVSSEISGGDFWYDNNGLAVAAGDVGGIQSVGIDTTIHGAGYQIYGPVTFQYTSPLQGWTKTGNVYTTDGSQYSVNSAINNASPGDTINVPAGTFTWKSITVNKAITLAGAGPGSTFINIPAGGPTFGSGVISITAPAVVRNFTITQSGAAQTTAFSTSGANGWRITGVTYNSGAVQGYFLYAGTYGLVDNCTLNLVVGSDEPIFARGPTDSWQTPSSLGTANAVFIESCTYNGPGYVCDINSNGRATVRYTTVNGTQKVDGHGVSTNSPPRSVRHMEIYDNNWTTSSTFWSAIEVRGGTGMIFDNTAPNTTTSFFYLTDYGYQGGPYANFGGILQTPANYPLADQIGVGMDPKVAASEPAYVWNNKENGASWPRTLHTATAAEIAANGGVSFTDADVIKPNRDFFADAGFDGTGNIGRGTKAAMLASSPAIVGAGWWVTDEASWNILLPANTSGQLYTWNGTAWVLKYTPYTYPHPLRKAPAPTNLAIVTAASSGTQVSLIWDHNAWDETGYKIFRSTNGGSYSQVATTGAGIVAYLDTGLTGGNTYSYEVSATNIAGDSAFSNIVSNGVAPAFTTQPATQTVITGANVTLSTVVSGVPTPTYQWKKNGSNLANGGNVSGATTDTLTLSAVTPADTATYTLVATNYISSATSNNAVLTVNVPPAFSTQPAAAQTITAGGSATFTSAATGIPTPTYQWQKNSVNISGATSATLTLSPLTLADTATYTVIATNAAGTATSTNAVLTVQVPPSITTQPAASQTFNAGGTATFTAAATGTPTPTYQWQKNGVNIPGATSATLTLTPLVPGDTGTYTVITTNPAGTVTSSNAVLTVDYAPTITTQPTAAQTINVGSTVIYTAAANGLPAPTYQWQKNSVDIAGATSATLTLSNVALTDAGTFTVIATNSLGSATSNNAVLTVVLGFAPVFTTSPVGATILLNNPITFTAAATGTPAPTFQWQKDGVAISGATGTSYTIPSVQATDGGIYTVVATNIVGPVTSAGATLVVNLVPPPAISAQPKSLTVASGHSVSFQAGATNSATYQWQVSADGGASWNAVSNSSTYSGSTTSTLTVTGASTSMNGYQYRVVATNSTSTVTSAAATLAVVTPVFPSPVDVAPNSKGNVLVDDSGTDVIQSVSSAGVATLLAGSAGKPGSTDDNGSYASFRVPGGFVLDSSGNLYLADTGNNLIRKITADGSVTTIAGQPGFQGFQDGAGSAAWFNLPGGITIDGSGNLYVADTGNSIIRKITPGGATVSTVAGSPSLRGTTNGTGSAARFNQPYGITADSAGNLYVADTLNQTIRKITPAGVVTTFAGAPGVSGSADGNGLTDALFNHPLGITIDAAGNLYVSDSGNNTIRLIKPDGTVSTLAGLPTIAGLKDGTGTDAWFNQPIGVRLDSAGTTLYVADNGNAAIRRVTLAGAVTTWAITQGTSTPSIPNPTPTPPPTTSGGSSNLPPSSTGGGGGAIDGWFIAALSVLSIMRWRRRTAQCI